MPNELNVAEIYMERVFNLGNYETLRIGLRATVTAKTDVVVLADKIEDKILAIRNGPRK